MGISRSTVRGVQGLEVSELVDGVMAEALESMSADAAGTWLGFGISRDKNHREMSDEATKNDLDWRLVDDSQCPHCDAF
jgi:hypothetical protein